jgi:hypothetical protein
MFNHEEGKHDMKKISIFLVTLLLLGVVALQPASVSAASKVKLNKTNVTLYAGEVMSLSASVPVNFKTSDNKVAAVSKKGLITAKKTGKVTITAVSKSNKKLTATCKVTVKKAPKTRQITLSDKSGEINAGNTDRILIKSVKGLSSDKVTYTSADKSVATVDSDGMITGVGAGSTKITVKAVCNPKVKAVYTITVKEVDSLSSKDFEVPGFSAGSYTVTYSDTDESYKAFTTARGIAIGSTKSEVINAYSNSDRDSAAVSIDAQYNRTGHIASYVYKYSYTGDGKTYSITFILDQCEKVMAIVYEVN